MVEALEEGHDVDVDHGLVLLPGGVLDLTEAVQAGHVAHEAHVQALGRGEDGLGSAGLAKVGAHDLGLHAVGLADLACQHVQLLLATADHDDVHAAGGDLLAERLADALGRAQDQAPLTVLLPQVHAASSLSMPMRAHLL